MHTIHTICECCRRRNLYTNSEQTANVYGKLRIFSLSPSMNARFDVDGNATTTFENSRQTNPSYTNSNQFRKLEIHLVVHFLCFVMIFRHVHFGYNVFPNKRLVFLRVKPNENVYRGQIRRDPRFSEFSTCGFSACCMVWLHEVSWLSETIIDRMGAICSLYFESCGLIKSIKSIKWGD